MGLNQCVCKVEVVSIPNFAPSFFFTDNDKALLNNLLQKIKEREKKDLYPIVIITTTANYLHYRDHIWQYHAITSHRVDNTAAIAHL